MSYLSDRAPQLTNANLLDWCSVSYQVPYGPTYPQYPNDGDFFFCTAGSIFTQWQADITQWVNLGPPSGFNIGALPTGLSPLQFYDTKSGAFANLYLIRVTETGNPLLMTDVGLAVKKDIVAGGEVLSGQGALVLGYSWTGSGSPTAYSPPLIELKNSSTSVTSGTDFPSGMSNQPGEVFVKSDGWLYIHSGNGNWSQYERNSSGSYDTLFLVKAGAYEAANLDLNDAYLHGAIKCHNNGVGYYSYYGGGGGGANGGIYLNEYGWIRFNGTNDTFWKVLTSAGSEVLAVPSGTGAGKAVWLSCSMNPNGAGVLGCGSGSSYWSGVVTNTIYRHYESSFDALDDLSLVKQYKTKKIA